VSETTQNIRRPKRPSGEIRPSGGQAAQPVYLTWGTLIKVVGLIGGPILLLIFSALMFFSETKTHLKNDSIHTTSTEKQNYITKQEANEKHEEILESANREIKSSIREIHIEQKQLFQNQEENLKRNFGKLLKEVKNGHD